MTIRLKKRFSFLLKNWLIFRSLLPLLTAGGLGCALLLIACNEVSCPLNNTVESVYGFYASTRDETGTLVEGETISIGDTLTITALGPNVELANRLIGKGSVKLPVSFYGDVDTLEFMFTDKLNRKGGDTLWISKNNLHHFDDPSCPVHIWHTITGVRSTHHLIDTVLINNAAVNYDGLENFQIYFFINTSDDEPADDEPASEESSE